MQSQPDSTYTYPALISDQLQKADTGETVAISAEFASYFTLVKRYCYNISKMIGEKTNGVFVPYYGTKTIPFYELISDERIYYRSSRLVVELPEDLLSVDSITIMGTAVTAEYYRLVDDFGSANGYPYRMIEFDTTGITTPGTDFNDTLVIAGEWGIHDSATDAYTSEVTTTGEALDASQTTIEVANGDGDLFEIYQYIRIDNELMHITAIDTSGDPDVLTVRRGVNGFTAATHDNGASITRWQVVNDVSMLATRMVAYWFHRRNDKGERVQVINDSLIIAQFSDELAAIAQERRRSIHKVV